MPAHGPEKVPFTAGILIDADGDGQAGISNDAYGSNCSDMRGSRGLKGEDWERTCVADAQADRCRTAFAQFDPPSLNSYVWQWRFALCLLLVVMVADAWRLCGCWPKDAPGPDGLTAARGQWRIGENPVRRHFEQDLNEPDQQYELFGPSGPSDGLGPLSEGRGRGRPSYPGPAARSVLSQDCRHCPGVGRHLGALAGLFL